MRCQEVYERAVKVIPGGVNSPVRAFKKVGGLPLIVASGNGEKIKDVDGREYVDYCGSWGAAILGHAPPEIVEAVIRQTLKGSSFGIATEVEEQIATKVTTLVPSVEKIRFVSSGTEATMTAIRLARGYTKRKKIIKFMGCYHGHSDALLVQAGSGALNLNITGVTPGAIADTLSLPFNNSEQVREVFAREGEEIAAVILEPIAANMGVVLPDPGFLETIRQETQRFGALLIFDEVITGFRVALGGAQQIFQITPDLSCFGKIIGGGFPAAAVGGKREIMDCLAPIGTVYQAGTLSGNPVAMSAGLATLHKIEQPGFYESLEKKTERLVGPIEKEIKDRNLAVCLQRQGSIFTLFFGAKKVRNQEDLQAIDEVRFADFFHTLLKEKIYIPPYQQEAWFVSSAHQEETLDRTAECVVNYLRNKLI